LEIVMVNVWEHVDAREEARHFCEVHHIQGPVLLDATGEYIARLGLRGVPHNVVVDTRGIVQAVGTTTPDEIRATLTRLLLPFGRR
jgi:hypothetical protein